MNKLPLVAVAVATSGHLSRASPQMCHGKLHVQKRMNHMNQHKPSYKLTEGIQILMTHSAKVSFQAKYHEERLLHWLTWHASHASPDITGLSVMNSTMESPRRGSEMRLGFRKAASTPKSSEMLRDKRS